MTKTTFLIAALTATIVVPTFAAEPSASAVFEQRIMPIFRSPNPSSCTECHLAGVDLKNYILPSSESTFRSLRDQGLIDVKRPDDSKILKLIRMSDPQAAGAQLIREEVRRAEENAFAAWLQACVRDKALVDSPPIPRQEQAIPSRPPEVIRHSRRDRLLASFENTIWALRFRCMSCHTEGSKDNDRLRREHGEQVTWIKSAGAAATMEYLIRSPLIDLKRPTKSLLLLKPLRSVEHGGGKKFLLGDQGYEAFRSWIEDYARTVQDGYVDAASLPPPETVQRTGTELWFKLTNTPQTWGDALVRVDIHAWDPQTSRWGERPAATSDRQNSPQQRLWQHTLTLLNLPPSGSQPKNPAPSLPDGRYQARVYVAGVNAGADGRPYPWNFQDAAGVVEFSTKWRSGYGNMTVVNAEQLKSP